MTPPDPACGGCGTTLRDASRFCPTCGRPVVGAPAAAGKAPLGGASGKASVRPGGGVLPAVNPPPTSAKQNWVIVSAVAGVVTAIAVATLLVVVGGGDDDGVAEGDEIAVDGDALDAGDDGSGSNREGEDPSTTPSTPTGPPPTSAEPALPRIDPSWVGIIRSFAVDRVPYTRAVNEAEDLTARGISADVLYSSNYTTMNGGYWVVYSGVFSTSDAASAHCLSIQPRLSNNCYPREANGYRAVPPPF